MNNTIMNPMTATGVQEPLVPKPSLEDFRLSTPAVFPNINELINAEVTPPRGLPGAIELQQDMDALAKDSFDGTRALAIMDAGGPRTAEEVVPGGRIEEPFQAAEVAAVSRDQIRWEPEVAIEAQANSTPANVLAVLR